MSSEEEYFRYNYTVNQLFTITPSDPLVLLCPFIIHICVTGIFGENVCCFFQTSQQICKKKIEPKFFLMRGWKQVVMVSDGLQQK